MKTKFGFFLAVCRPIVAAFMVTLFCSGPVASHAKPPKKGAAAPVLARAGRSTIVIDDSWKFLTDPANVGESEAWQNKPTPDAIDLIVPSLWVANGVNYKGAAWYWRSFDIPASWKGQTCRLMLHAVAGSAKIWLNGTLLGDHANGDTPFEFNITSSIKIGSSNLVAVKVSGTASDGAGIWQGVEVVAHDEAYISKIRVVTDNFGRLTAEVGLLNTSKNEGDATLEAHINNVSAKSKEITTTHQNLHLTPAQNVTNLIASVRGKDLTLWSPGTPTLYALLFAFKQDKDILDTDEVKFGFRTIGVATSQFTLNGNAVDLKSLNINLNKPAVLSSTVDVDKARALISRAKQAGINLLYLEAAHPEMLALTDELGMMVIEGTRPNADQQYCDNTLNELIRRDWNHPSIIGWNITGCSSDYEMSAAALDSSRLLIRLSGTPQLFAPGKTTTTEIPAGLLPVSAK